jgi:hypothetical protein
MYRFWSALWLLEAPMTSAGTYERPNMPRPVVMSG